MLLLRKKEKSKMDILLRKLMETDPTYQKEKKQQKQTQAKFHKENPQMKELLMKSDEDTTYLMTDNEE